MAEKIIEQSSLSMYENDMMRYSIVVNRRRMIPEVRDGLIPVQRRVLFGAYKDGQTSPNKKDKSASLVGTTMRRYHPHGDCLHANTLLYQLNGNYITIGDAYKLGIKEMDILAVDTNTGKIIPAKAHSFRIGQYTNKEYHIVLSNGSEVVCTANHPFLLPDLTWVKAENLTEYSRLYNRTLKLYDRPYIDNNLVQNIVYDYYNGTPPQDGIVRHYIDGNFYNNIPENIAGVSRSEHARIHGNDDKELIGLEAGRESMFSENGKYREIIKRKNSILMSSFNKDQGIFRFKKVIQIMQERGMELTEENYETFRSEVYNLPIVSRLLSNHPELNCSTFEDLVNVKVESIGEKYNRLKNNTTQPIEFSNNTIFEKQYNNGSFSVMSDQVFNVFDRIIDQRLPFSIETYYSITQKGEIDPDKLMYLMDLYRVERPFITNIYTVDVDNEPMYDFTVDGVENMMIPLLSNTVDVYSQIRGSFVPMISVHNSGIYGAIVTLVSWFKSKYPLMYGKGNWGNVSGDGAAAQRYTECALSNFGYDVLIDELSQANNIVDWIDTYKRNGDKEPEFLPAKVPILLINGAFGIGVGMSINIPSHNLTDVVEAARALLRNPNENIVLIPDLCQPCTLIDTDWKSISETGRGSFKARGNIITETNKKGNITLHITSLPDNVNTTMVYDKILKMVEDKQMPMIKDIFNALTDGKPDITIQLKPGSDPEYVKQAIYAKTDVQKTISVNFEAVSVDGIDIKRYSYREYLLTFIDQRMNTKFRLYCNKLQQVMTRHHQVDAFVKVLESGEIDNIINMIRKQKGTDDSVIIEHIIKKVGLSDIQSKFIINTNLSRLSIGHLNKYKEERKNLDMLIKQYTAAVTDDGTIIKNEIDQELQEISRKYGGPRLCKVVNIDDENQIPKGTFKIVITERNYIRKIPDIDKVGIVRKDNPKFILKVDNAENLLIFDNKGKVFNLPISKVPITDRNSPGTDIRILIRNLTSDIISVYYEPIFQKIAKSGAKHYLTILTRSNTIKKLDIEDFLNVNPSGLIYSKIRDEDEVVGIVLAPHNLDVVICSGHKALRCTMKDIPLFKRNATGSKAMDTTEPINGLSVIYPDASDIIVVTKNGKFNRFNIAMMSTHARARKGSSVIKLDSNDEIFNIFGVNESDKIRLLTSEGVEEIAVSDIKVKSSIAAGQKMTTTKGVIVRADIVR